MTQGADLRAAREQAQVSLTQMAQRTHFTKSYLSLVETGKRAAGDYLIAAYGRVLGSMANRIPSLDELAGMLSATRKLEDETSAAHVLPSVHAQRRLVDNVKPDGAATGLASEIEQYLGWLHIPRGAWRESERHLNTAAVLALQAGDAQRLAVALSFQSYRAMEVNDLPSAEALNEAAFRDTRVDPGLRAYMQIQRAEIQALRGDTRSAAETLTAADRLVENLPAPEELPASSYWYTPAVLLGHKGFALEALGDHRAARHAASDSLALMPESWSDSEWAVKHRRLAEG